MILSQQFKAFCCSSSLLLLLLPWILILRWMFGGRMGWCSYPGHVLRAVDNKYKIQEIKWNTKYKTQNTNGGVGAMVSLRSNQSGGQVCGLILSRARHSAAVSSAYSVCQSQLGWHPLSGVHPQLRFSQHESAKTNQEYQSQVWALQTPFFLLEGVKKGSKQIGPQTG